MSERIFLRVVYGLIFVTLLTSVTTTVTIATVLITIH